MFRISLIALMALAAFSQGNGEEDDYKAYGQHWQTVEKTKHYKIYSMLGGTLTEEIAKRQELILKEYKRVFPKKKFPKVKEKVVFPVLIFESRGGYEAFSRANGFDPETAVGYYSPSHKYTVLFYGTDESLISTLFHEAFHQFLDHVLPNTKSIPTWLNEGLASFFGGAKYDKKFGTVSVQPGDVNVSDINQTRKAMLTDSHVGLEELMKTPHEKFHEEEQESLYYSQGLSVVYFLINWGGKRKTGIKLLVSYFKALEAGKDIEEAYAEVFEKKMPKMEKYWKKTVLSMKF
ncbi:MAG: DUF1570 domain-containing protein [Planctomycetota bacterium]|nr:DUF1570 domain-containing protein [Planctomycetota bacterium]